LGETAAGSNNCRIGMGGAELKRSLARFGLAEPYRFACAAALLAGAAPAPAWAQRVISPGNVAPGSPGIASPLPGDIVPQGSPIPRVLPSAPPAVGPGPGLPLAAPTPVAAGNVAIRSVRVEGATAYGEAQTAPLVTGLVGPSVPLARIEAARTALLNLYRGSGYALTSVTATIDQRNGALRFTVVEGRIAEVKLEGDIGPAGTQVLRFLNHLTELRPIDTASLERWLLLAQDVPGVTLRAVLRPSGSEPGALTLVAQVDRQKVAGLLNIDNRAFRLTGPEEGLVLLDFNSFTEFGERTEATFYHTNGNTQNFGQVTTEAFLGSSGLRGRLYAGYGEANPSGFLRDARYQGTTTVFGGSLTYPLIRARQQTLNVSGYFDAIETKITQVAATATGIQRGFDSLRVARLGADYALQDAWAGDARPAINSVNVRLSQGIPSLGASTNNSPEATRPGERVDFTKLVMDVSRVQTLFSVWTDSSVTLKGRVIGQISGEVLPPAEKFFLGGAEFNRGFYAGQVTGDNAFVWQLELQFNTNYDLQAFDRNFNIAAQFYAFYDRGEAWQRNSEPDARLSSMGIGVRLNVTRYTEFNIEGVHRNTRRYGGQGQDVSPLKADAAYWRVITRF
jgi:hemolysin activation/secretion protein